MTIGDTPSDVLGLRRYTDTFLFIIKIGRQPLAPFFVLNSLLPLSYVPEKSLFALAHSSRPQPHFTKAFLTSLQLSIPCKQ